MTQEAVESAEAAAVLPRSSLQSSSGRFDMTIVLTSSSRRITSSRRSF